MPRFFCPLTLSIGASVPLPEDVSRHIHVLRLREGDAVTLFDGSGGEYAAKLTALDKKRSVALVGAFSPREAELPYPITLAQVLPEGQKMDEIIEKAVELGVAAIQPLSAQRAVVKLTGERLERRAAHWQAVVVAASEQCGRNRLAEIAPLADFARWVAQPTPAPRILFSPRAEQALPDWARQHAPHPVTLVIGPEGGFSPDEEALAVRHEAILLSLGERVLRTETAGMAAVAALTAIWNG